MKLFDEYCGNCMMRRIDIRLTYTEAEFLIAELRPDRKMSAVLLRKLKAILEKASGAVVKEGREGA